ncbi:hypothetical protein I79_025063 [Cricetulus griseus]|uniref:Uncharacterized protein n=1 Tax=Cricetulus griseus TaxID=10029 RepID=G3IMC5_CRIGR|nr:hypothetical protein I79_025063 [Cricetulus griseus]
MWTSGAQNTAIKGYGVPLLLKYSHHLDLFIILTRECVQSITHKQSIPGRTIPCSNGTDVLEKLIEKLIH